MRRFVAKAQADGARGVVLVPLAITASYWPRLVAAARPIGNQSFVHIRNPETVLVDAQGHLPPALAVFAVDFGSSSPRRCDSYAPACGQERAWRGRPLLGHPSDVADRKRIHDELQRRLRNADVGIDASSLLALRGCH